MSIRKELPLLIIVFLPFLYLGYIWNQLPAQIPMQWNFSGEVSRYGIKAELLLIPFLLPILTYLIFTIVPKIDPKNKLGSMGKKLQSLKFVLTTFMSILALYIIYTAANHSLDNPNLLIMMLGVLYLILGNYFKTIKANYFIGIRTPWTLENEIVWKETHKLGGKMWFVAGIIIILSSLILEEKLNMALFLIITAIITVVPFVYSYLIFKKQMIA